jgi:hypothetical protein
MTHPTVMMPAVKSKQTKPIETEICRATQKFKKKNEHKTSFKKMMKKKTTNANCSDKLLQQNRS